MNFEPRTKTILTVCLPLLAVLVLTHAVAAIEMYSSFGPDDSFNANTGQAVGAAGNSPNIHVGWRFTSTLTGRVRLIELAGRVLDDGGKDTMELSLWTAGAEFPDTLFWTGTVDVSDTTSIFFTFTGSPAPELEAGEDYFLTARSSNGLDAYAWNHNDQGIESFRVIDEDGGMEWSETASGVSTQAAFRLEILGSANPGDINLDGVLNLLDVEPFIDLIISGEYLLAGDFNHDCEVNLLDVELFIECITNCFK